MNRLLQAFKQWGWMRKLTALFALLLIIFISWRGYVQIRTNQNISALRNRGFAIILPVESTFGLPTPWGTITLWKKKADSYVITTGRRLKDKDLPGIIEALKKLEKPFELGFRKSEFTDLDGFEKLTKLRRLSLSDHLGQLQDIDALNNMTWIRSLSIRNAKNLKSIDSLGTLDNLIHLSVSGEQICDLTPLHRLKKLTSVDFHRCNVTKQQIEEFRKATGSTATLSWSLLREKTVSEDVLQTREPTHAEGLAQ